MLSRRMRAVPAGRAASCGSSSIDAQQRRAFLKGVFGNKADAKADGGNKSDAKDDGGMGGMFPPGMGALGPKMMKEFMSKSPDQQVAMMKQAVEMQRKFGGSIPGMGKMNEKNAEFMESMIKNLEEKVAATSGAASGSAATTSPAAPTTASSASASPKASSSSASTPKASGAKPTFRSASGPTLEELRKINLGAEIEELFAELGSMRAKRNHYRSELEKKEATVLTAQKESDEHKAKAADLRSRLSASENTIRIMNTETVSLKSQVQSLKAVQEDNRRLNVRVSALQSNDTMPLKERISALEAELEGAQDSVKALQRKLDRMRRRDLVAQFSLLLNDIRTSNASAAGTAVVASQHHEGGHHAHQPPTAATLESESARHSELFSAVQDAYDTAVHESWERCGPKAAAALVAACEAYLQNLLGRAVAKLDAHVTLAPHAAAAGIEAIAKEKGYTVSRQPDGSLIVALPGDADAPSFVGPFAVCAAYALLNGSVVASVKPFITEGLARNAKRAVVNTSTTRSSGPGGQAANTAETQVSMTLVLDDERMFVSEAQDTRSQFTNKDLAQTRLFAEKLDQHNKKLAHVRLDVVGAAKASAAAEGGGGVAALLSERWVDVTSGIASGIASLSTSDRAIVEAVSKAVTSV